MENIKNVRNKKAISAYNERRKAGTGEQSEAKKDSRKDRLKITKTM